MTHDEEARLASLEQLASLYERGVLNAEEFAAEKLRLLGDGATPPVIESVNSQPGFEHIPPDAPLFAGSIGAKPGRRTPILVISCGVLAAVGVASALAFMRFHQLAAPVADSASPSPTAAPSLEEAFQMAYGVGKTSARINGYDYKPVRLVALPAGLALVAEGTMPFSEASHATPGRIAISYLQSGPQGWKVARTWRSFLEKGSNGEVGEIRTRDDLFLNPGLTVTSGGTWQGCSASETDLIELAPEGPKDWAAPLTSYQAPDLSQFDDTSASDADRSTDSASGGSDHPGSSTQAGQDTSAGDTDGKIEPIVRGKSFKVTYSGSSGRVVTYTLVKGKYRASANVSGLPSC